MRVVFIALLFAGCAAPAAPHGTGDAGAPALVCSESCEHLVASEHGLKSVEAVFVAQDPSDPLHSTIMVDFASCHSNASSDCYTAQAPCVTDKCPSVVKPGSHDEYSRIYTTRDGGKTYTLARFAPQDRTQGSTDENRLDMTSSVAGGQAVMTMLVDGSVLVAGSRNLPSGTVDVVGAYSRPEVRLLKSTDGGLTFPASRAIVDALPGATSDVASRNVPNELTISASRMNAVLCWAQADPAGFPGPSTLDCATSSDGGEAWSSPAQVALAPIFIGNPVSSISEDGTAFVGWLNADSQTSFRAMVSKGQIGNATWSSVPIDAQGSIITAMFARSDGLDVAMTKNAETADNFTLRIDRLDSASWRTLWTSEERGDFNCAYARLAETHDTVVIGWGSRPLECGPPDGPKPTLPGSLVLSSAGQPSARYVAPNTMAPAVSGAGSGAVFATARWSATGTDVLTWTA